MLLPDLKIIEGDLATGSEDVEESGDDTKLEVVVLEGFGCGRKGFTGGIHDGAMDSR